MAIYGNERAGERAGAHLWEEGRRSEHLHAAGERAGERAGAYPMDAELSRYLYPHWSRNGMKHLCCWKPPCVCDWHPIW